MVEIIALTICYDSHCILPLSNETCGPEPAPTVPNKITFRATLFRLSDITLGAVFARSHLYSPFGTRSDQRSRSYIYDRVQLDRVRCDPRLSVVHVEEEHARHPHGDVHFMPG